MNGMNGSSVAGDAAPSINGAEEGSVDEEIPLEFEEDAVEWHDAVASHDLHEDEPSVDPQLFGHLAPVPCAPLDADADLPPHPLPAAERGAAVSAMRAAVLASDGAEKVALWEDRSPATLERFLRARDFDVPVAAALFLDHRKWREGFGWSVPSSSVPSKEFDQQKVALQAVSKDGKHPLLVLLARNHVTAGRVVAEVRSYVVYTLDKLCDFLPPGGQFVVLVDFVGMTSKNADVKARRALRGAPSPVLLTLAAAGVACLLRNPAEAIRGAREAPVVLQPAHHLLVLPGYVLPLITAHAPLPARALWSVVKPFVAPKTREKARKSADICLVTCTHSSTPRLCLCLARMWRPPR